LVETITFRSADEEDHNDNAGEVLGGSSVTFTLVKKQKDMSEAFHEHLVRWNERRFSMEHTETTF